MPKHDPLPWQHIAVEGGWDGVGDKDRRTICKLALNNPENAKFIVRAVNSHYELLEACRAAKVFIRNGVALGYIRMPDKDVPDPAHKTPEMLRAAIRQATGGE